MFLEGLFGGGSQSGAPNQSSPSSGSTETPAATGGNSATPPANGSQADTVETYTPEETDDGTYAPTPSAETSADEPADNTAEPEDSASQPSEKTDGAATTPAVETDTRADDAVAEQPASSEPTSPVAEAPVDHANNTGSAEKAAASMSVRDFVTPLLADLEAIKQRSASRSTDDVSASQRRAAANVHDQMIRQMFDQISANGSSSARTRLFEHGDTEQTQSLPARWYAEA